MRSEQWLCGTTVDIQQISKARRIKHVRSNRDILRESDSRYSRRPGTWQMGMRHDLSPLAWTRREDRRLTRPSGPAKGRRRPWDRLESF
jgi:hypothetical protein